MKHLLKTIAPIVLAGLLLSGCNGGGGSVSAARSVTGTVQVSWSANREAAVNRAGGGYKVYYSTTPGFDIATASVVDVPYASGATAPISTTLTLASGTYYVKVVAYSVLNAAGSQPSTELSVNVPFGS